MKRIGLSALALTVATGGAVVAETHMTDDATFSGVVSPEVSQNVLRAENIIDADIYTLEAEYDETTWFDTDYYDEIDTDWEEIGEIEDIVISRDGQIMGLVAEVGGWLDIGDNDVIIDMNDLRLVGDTVGNVAFVTRLSEEQLEARQEVDDAWGW
ncbi:PRC-barrel domain-containing protein [Tranquillimonas alkanivorans]|uniref:PRC-barrel domain-containing protein n=1 Tax=Tranquillimonas alkanivorans TaxID=441119 RepID=A0A1I5NZR3_9RHOB|nr:PRC-barrel domain-containing protein [Tranquillimonas alkanivorans]SFP27272.1 PRC-barrel domain-containing protein [Tranquillimonas alkanivorans]